MKRIFSVILLISILLSLAACSQGKKAEQTQKTQAEVQKSAKVDYLNYESNLPIANKPITIKFVTQHLAAGGSTQDLWFWKWLEQKGNIKAEVTQIVDSAWNERKNIMFASNSLPDAFLNCVFSSDDMMRYGQIEKQFMPITNLINDYGPNIKNAFSQNPDAKADVTNPDGNIYGLPTIFDIKQYSTTRPWIHSTWLEKLGLKDPKDLDEFYEVLKAFKGMGPNIIPFGGSWDQGQTERTVVLSAIGLPANNLNQLILKNNTITMPAKEPVLKEYFSYFNKLYTQGLMDKDIFTQTDVQANAKASQNIVGVSTAGAPFVIDPQHWNEYKALKPLASKWSTTPIWPGEQRVMLAKLVLSSNAKYPEALIKMADIFFTDEGRYLFWWGPEKGSKHLVGDYKGWTSVNGVITYDYTDKAKDVWAFQLAYVMPIYGNKLGLINNMEKLAKYTGIDVHDNDYAVAWRKSMDERVLPNCDKAFPTLYLQQKQLERKNELAAPINDYINQMEAKFITGQEPIDNFDKYLQQLKNLKIDEYLSIYQSAYD